MEKGSELIRGTNIGFYALFGGQPNENQTVTCPINCGSECNLGNCLVFEISESGGARKGDFGPCHKGRRQGAYGVWEIVNNVLPAIPNRFSDVTYGNKRFVGDIIIPELSLQINLPVESGERKRRIQKMFIRFGE